jgi:hypothetical protein
VHIPVGLKIAEQLVVGRKRALRGGLPGHAASAAAEKK